MPDTGITSSGQGQRALRGTGMRRGSFSRRSEAVLLKEVSTLKELVGNLTARVAELEQEAESARAIQTDGIIVLREIGKEQARKEIIESFEAGEPLDQADLADALSLDFSLVVEICDELIKEGVVVFYDDDRS